MNPSGLNLYLLLNNNLIGNLIGYNIPTNVKGPQMYKLLLTTALLLQGILYASDVNLLGLETQAAMTVDLESPSNLRILEEYRHSPNSIAVVLDLYWSQKCTNIVTELNTFISNPTMSGQYGVLLSLKNSKAKEDKLAYTSIIHSERILHCEDRQSITKLVALLDH